MKYLKYSLITSTFAILFSIFIFNHYREKYFGNYVDEAYSDTTAVAIDSTTYYAEPAAEEVVDSTAAPAAEYYYEEPVKK